MYLYDLNIYRVINIQEKSKIVEDVILDLPDWIGVAENMEKYIEDAKRLPLWVAKNNEDIIGFIMLEKSSKDTCQLHAMGIKKIYQNLGVGKKLYYILEEEAKEDYQYIQAKILEGDNKKHYNQTIGFLKSLGFKKLETSKTIWDDWNPVLVMGKKI